MAEEIVEIFSPQESESNLTQSESIVTQSENIEESQSANSEIESIGSQNVGFRIVAAARSTGHLLFTESDGQLYVRSSRYRNIGHWYRCRIANCNARIFLDSAKTNCRSGKQNVHSHSFDQRKTCDELTLKNKIKSECEQLPVMDASAQQINDIFHRNVREAGDIELSFDKMSRNLMRLRSKFLPKTPKTAAEIILKYNDPTVMANFGYSWVRFVIFFFFSIFLSET